MIRKTMEADLIGTDTAKPITQFSHKNFTETKKQ